MNLYEIEKEEVELKKPDFSVGDTVRVHVKIKEGEKERIQIFEGIVIGFKNSGIRRTFKVRKLSFGVGVERTFPLYSPNIAKIEITHFGKVRRAKLYFLRNVKSVKDTHFRVDNRKVLRYKKRLEEEKALTQTKKVEDVKSESANAVSSSSENKNNQAVNTENNS